MGSMTGRNPAETDSSPVRSFLEDNRAIEGLPIRLVIALIVGVMALGIMLNILGGIGGFEGDAEIEMEYEENSVEIGTNSNAFTVGVVDENGQNVEGATIVATAGEARMDDAIVMTTDDTSSGGADYEAVFDFDAAGLELAPDQDVGTIEFEARAPPGTDWTDNEPNDPLLVVE